MKYIVVIPDGLTDFYPFKGRKPSPLEKAYIPNIDYLLCNGLAGTVNTIPKGLSPGSDVANMSLLGIDPRTTSIGRAALEALSQGIELKKNQTAFRMNFVTIKNNKLTDYTGGEIKTKDAKKIIQRFNKHFTNDISFYPGVSYRNIAVINRNDIKIKTEPAHNITGKDIAPYQPKGRDKDYIRSIMNQAHQIIISCDHVKNKNLKTNHIWLWGEGYLEKSTSFYQKYRMKGAVISAVDIVRGIAKLLKMDVLKVPGITGDINTSFTNKAKYALKYLDQYDLVYVHVEATDEAGHKGNFKEKRLAVEKIDQDIIKPLLHSKKKFNIVVVPDHPTPLSIQTHYNQEVPFVLYSKYKKLIPNHKYKHYSEKIIKDSPIRIKKGDQFIQKMVDLIKKNR